jgi:hypothetical protein
MAIRRQKKYRNLSRRVSTNRYKADAVKRAQQRKGKKSTPFNDLKDYLHEKFLKWVWHTLAHLLGTKHEFQTYTNNETGIYTMQSGKNSGEITLALAADWATNTHESTTIAAKMNSHYPDYTIHLGDTYYAGSVNEIFENFLIPNAPWKKGACGSFALMGNHEMYSMAKAYYEDLLPALGVFDKTLNKYKGQAASFFCLQTDFWLIIGLDTGYNSVGFPFVWNSLSHNSKLPEQLIDWMKNTLNLASDMRGIIFLSHHQYVSGFEKEKDYSLVGQQIASIVGEKRKVLWLWGHEHRLALYGTYKSKGGVTAYGRCIGHGGMPIELDKMVVDPVKAVNSNLIGYDARIRNTIDHDNTVGLNGYAVLKIEAEKLTIEYHDWNKLLLEETWVSDIQTGTITGQGVRVVENNPMLKIMPRKNWNDLVK